MNMFSKVLAATIVLLLTANIEGVFGIRFLIDGKECFSYKAEYGATVQFSFVVIIVEDTDDWHYTVYGTDLVGSVRASQTLVVATILVLLTDIIGGVFGIRFTISRRECFSHKAEYGATVRFSFVVINVEDHEDWGDWHYTVYGTDLVVKGPNGELIQEFRDKTSENSEFVAHSEGLYQFCFSNQSPFQETLDFDVHSSHFYRDAEHAKDDHLKPIMEQIEKLDEALWSIRFAQSWLKSEADRHAIINEKISKRAMHKAVTESFAMIVASVLQVYLLTRLFKRKLGMSSV